MLRVNPEERINAEQALDHPYFKIEPELTALKPKWSMASTIESESPNMKEREKISMEKDSCIELKLGKQNIMNGNLETVPDAKTKVSMFGQAMTPGRVSKISKFSRAL